MNPSTRPVVAGRHGRDADRARRRRPITLPNPPGVPAENTNYPPGGPIEEIPFTVKGPADGVDNGRMTVHIEWASPDTDWDIYVIGPNGEIVDAVGLVRRHHRGRGRCSTRRRGSTRRSWSTTTRS